MAVEEYVRRRGVELGREAGQQRQAGAELVDEEAVGLEVGELAREDGDLQDEVYLAEDGAEDGEARQDRRRHDGVAADADVESAVAGFVEAVTRVAVAREDDDSVAALLQANGSVHDQALGAADAQIRVQKDDRLAFRPGRRLLSLFLCHVAAWQFGREASVEEWGVVQVEPDLLQLKGYMDGCKLGKLQVCIVVGIPACAWGSWRSGGGVAQGASARVQ